MRDIIEFEGKRYPRYWGDKAIGLNEAMARMGAKSYHTESTYFEGSGVFIMHANLSDVPDGIEYYSIYAQSGRPADRWHPAIFYLDKPQIDSWLKGHNLPLCDDVEPLAEKKADPIAKEQKAN